MTPLDFWWTFRYLAKVSGCGLESAPLFPLEYSKNTELDFLHLWQEHSSYPYLQVDLVIPIF
ncbi:MAG TPA: hypothetical protein QGF70_02235, partial [Candidatus Thalassarchaeaceae archaeon]|nr:hypothetical protein [Candidatus Thalassarchaeaceae archaeon]